MDKEHSPQQIQAKADQHFARKEYGPAKEAYARALQLAPNGKIQARIRACEQQLAQQRKEQIKKGRRLEKKGQFAGALGCFSQALESAHEDWLEKKVEQLGRHTQESQAKARIEQIQGITETSERLAACNDALAEGASNQLREEKLACLIQLERYTEAITLCEEQAPDSVQGCYDYGYALITSGLYYQGLEQWAPLISYYPELLPQVEVCLPGLTRELQSNDLNWALPHQLLNNLPPGAQTPTLESYQHYFTCRYIEELLSVGEHSRIEALLPSLPEPVTPPQLGFLARLYFSLAEKNIRWLEPAISYWLSAIHNNELLKSLCIHKALADAPDFQALHAGLLQLMQELVDRYAREGQLSATMKTHWQVEKLQIERLADLPIDAGGLTLFPCTPAFAHNLGLAKPILDQLRTQRTELGLEDRHWLELSAQYSPLGQYLIRIEAGSEEKVFSALPPPGSDPLNTYLRQYIAMNCGLGRIHSGERKNRKFFQIALPLLKDDAHFRQQLIDLTYSEPNEKVLSSLTETMEFLSQHLQEADFLQAAAHSVAADVENLLHKNINLVNVEKRLKRALSIYPDTPQAKSLLAEVRLDGTYKQLGKAFRNNDFIKAARIVRTTNEPEVTDFFFETMENWCYEMSSFDRPSQLHLLKEMHKGCLALDSGHPTTLKIAVDLKQRELG